MTQSELDSISDAIASGKIVEGWGGERYDEIHVLRRLDPDQLWARKPPAGKWVECA